MSVQIHQKMHVESYDSDYDTYSDDDDDNECDYYDNNDDDVDYYQNDSLSDDSMMVDASEKDPEYFNFQLLDKQKAGEFVDSNVNVVSESCGVSIGEAKLALKQNKWNVNTTVTSLKRKSSSLGNNNNNCELVTIKRRRMSCEYECPVCYTMVDESMVRSLDSCGHAFCSSCWESYFQIQISSGSVSKILCMENKCVNPVSDEFVLMCVSDAAIKTKFNELVLTDSVVTHPELRFCPGADCTVIVQADVPAARRVNCDKCQSSFCFSCGGNYHAPVECSTMKKWRQKLDDDSETANYMVANTKDCPNCNSCIEKNGGCNHMHCYSCSFDFCWVCLGDWASHGRSYYECSRYKENPDMDTEKAKTDARLALEKYLFYFQRWENHAKSLLLEDQTREKIQVHINEKVMQSVGTWIDWQYLLDAADLLKKCRYTLQYTYPCAYYMESGSRKDCFEYLQGQLEAEVENLSWKVERAEITDRADLERQMDIAEKRRVGLLKDFLQE